MLNEEKRSRQVEVISRPHATLDGAGGSTPTVPFPAAQDSPNPPPTDKNKRVVALDSDDKGTREGIIFKRQRLVVAATSYSATDGRPPSFRDHPPVPPLLAHSSRSKAVGRALLGVTKCPLLLSSSPYSNMVSGASKRRRRRRHWE